MLSYIIRFSLHLITCFYFLAVPGFCKQENEADRNGVRLCYFSSLLC